MIQSPVSKIRFTSTKFLIRYGFFKPYPISRAVKTLVDMDGSPNEAWDGTLRGAPAATNVFVWRIHKARFKNGAELRGPREGTVTIVR